MKQSVAAFASSVGTAILVVTMAVAVNMDPRKERLDVDVDDVLMSNSSILLLLHRALIARADVIDGDVLNGPVKAWHDGDARNRARSRREATMMLTEVRGDVSEGRRGRRGVKTSRYVSY